MLFPTLDKEKNEYDVVICGGGLASQTLARQLRLKFPAISIAIIEKETFPLPAAACKVGESTVEIGAYYFAESLNLKDYFKNAHFVKLGLRFFTGGGNKCISKRPEVGLSKYSPYDSFQIDRGGFENDLFKMNKRAGVEIMEGCSVKEIGIGDDNKLHEITCRSLKDDQVYSVYGKWVMDAMGRRSFLQRKFGLKVDLEENYSAAWFRVKGRFDYSDTVPEDAGDWFERVPNDMRYYSTSHMMGKGYWVWVIPLSSGYTSIGIVTSEREHPCISYNNQIKAMKWLEAHEPYIHDHLSSFEFVDFHSMKNYAYSSKQVFSENRWACVGDAALFADPFYSNGSNVIGFGNSCVTKMIELDLKNALTHDIVDHFSNFIISYNDSLIWNIHSAYPYFGNAQVMSLNILWDTVVGWALVVPQMFNSIYLDPTKNLEITKITSDFFEISFRVKQLFLDWNSKSSKSFAFDFIDYLSIPFIKEIYNRNLKKNKSFTEILDDYKFNVQILDRFAQVIFLLAVEDTMPEKMALFCDPVMVNSKAISLHPNKWEDDGLFNFVASGKGPGPLLRQIRELFKFINTKSTAEPPL